MSAERTMIDTMARAVFVADHPKNMILEDWDSGAVLGADNGYRKHCYDVARAALRSILDHGPTPAMVMAGDMLTYRQERFKVSDVFRAMIAAVLEGGANAG